VSAPGGLCESCRMPMKWCFAGPHLLVHCPRCTDFLEEDFGTHLARATREGREAVMAEVRPLSKEIHSNGS